MMFNNVIWNKDYDVHFMYLFNVIFVIRSKSGLKRSILIGWTNTLPKMTDFNSFSELHVMSA